MTLPTPPYYAVIFTSRRTAEDEDGYQKTARLMEELARQQPGYLGLDSVRDKTTREGITVSYWQDEASIRAWKKVIDHAIAQKTGRTTWYEKYAIHMARVERSYDFDRNRK